MFWLDWLAGIFLVLSAPLIPLFMALVGMGAEKLNQQHFETVSRLSGQFLDKVRGLTTLQLFGQTEAASRTLEARSDQYRKITMKTLKVAFLSSAVLEFFASVAIAVLAIYIGFGLLGYIEFGPSDELTLFSGLLILLLAPPEFFQPLRTLSQHYHDRAAALGGAGARFWSGWNSLSTTQSRSGQTTALAIKAFRSPGGSRSVTARARSSSITWISASSRSGDRPYRPPLWWRQIDLLHLLAGFIQPEAGAVSVFGEAPGNQPFGWLGQRGASGFRAPGPKTFG